MHTSSPSLKGMYKVIGCTEWLWLGSEVFILYFLSSSVIDTLAIFQRQQIMSERKHNRHNMWWPATSVYRLSGSHLPLFVISACGVQSRTGSVTNKLIKAFYVCGHYKHKGRVYYHALVHFAHLLWGFSAFTLTDPAELSALKVPGWRTRNG